MGGHKFFVADIGGLQFYQRRLFVNLGAPSEENASPLIHLSHFVEKHYSMIYFITVWSACFRKRPGNEISDNHERVGFCYFPVKCVF